ncbi:hypothetical protein [Bacillus subtilis]|uniref:hypothetical protein n=1 Tax=Bacillus subtilis TaxID=1423 RepID=UPI002DBE5EA2|nr:hypothetical protein [Bacillus subtilis]MEC1878399.1 hypothetical protein [Bacillus subtilis]MEC1936606.1 hypothetical protein [Bacillus subtilis]
MIEYRYQNNSWFFTSEIKETDTGIDISAGELRHKEEVYPLEAVSFDLTPDHTFPVEYTLYMHMNKETKIVSWSLCKCYLDGTTFCDYYGSDQLIHFPVSVRVSPDGTREGTILMCKEEEEAKNEA